MKNKNTGFKHLVLLFAFILCLFSCVSAKAANYYYEDGYKYTLSLGKATNYKLCWVCTILQSPLS